MMLRAGTQEETVDCKVVEELASLLAFVPPDRLRKNISYIYFQYIINTKMEYLPTDLDQITSDLYFLLQFLQTVEDSRM